MMCYYLNVHFQGQRVKCTKSIRHWNAWHRMEFETYSTTNAVKSRQNFLLQYTNPKFF